MCAIERSNAKVDVGKILKRYLEHFSSYTFQNLNTELEHGFKSQSMT